MTFDVRDSNDVTDSWQWDRPRIEKWQVDYFNRQLEAVLPQNSFYRDKLKSAGLPLSFRLQNLTDLSYLPIMSKEELVRGAENSPTRWSTHHTYSPNSYSRLHRTSGTQGTPLLIGDTLQDWKWWSTNWQHVLSAAKVTEDDRVFLAFSFGPFIGFWSAHQACVDRGAMVIPAGGMTSIARLEFLRQSAATVVCCTPTYAMRLAEVARAEGFPLSALPVSRLIVAGEPGGSLPELRNAITNSWQADVIDHSGATEIGPWGFGWPDRCGLHIIETSFIAEVLPLPENADCPQPLSLQPTGSDTISGSSGEVSDGGKVGELVLTSLGRLGAPVIRYRTGDVVRIASATVQPSNCNFLWLPEGIIGRSDDMLTVRGVNVFPSGIDNLVRSLSATAEYQVKVSSIGFLQQLSVNIEADAAVASQLEKLLANRLGLRVNVVSVPAGSLPRSESKASRWLKE